MKPGTIVLGLAALIKGKKLKKMLEYAKNNNDEHIVQALKEKNRVKYSTLAIIFLIAIPFMVYTFCSIMYMADNPKYPNGATKEVRGHISLYEDTFWYTDSSQKYTFDFEDYNIDESYEPGEIIWIYLDDDNNVVSVAHKTDETNYKYGAKIIIAFWLPVILLVGNYYLARKTYAKNWYSFVEWHNEEIEPYSNQANFEEIVATKQYYKVLKDVKDLSVEEQKLYRKNRFKSIFYPILLIVVSPPLMVILFDKLNIDIKSLPGLIIIIIYCIVFYILTDNCEVEMRRLRSGYYKKNENKERQ